VAIELALSAAAHGDMPSGEKTVTKPASESVMRLRGHLIDFNNLSMCLA
jgi:hypothetical protein